MKHIEPIYKVNNNISMSTLYDYGFRKTIDWNMIYKFSVYKYKNKPLIFGEFIYNVEEQQIHIIVKDINGNSYNYNKEEYGKSELIDCVNKEINKRIEELKKKGIIE